jgi:hypothetical protein
MATCLLAGMGVRAAERTSRLLFVCLSDNDLFQASGAMAQRFDRADAAIQAAQKGAGVLLLADQYPQETTLFDATMLEQARRKKLRLYVEYPSWLPGSPVGAPTATRWERAVVISSRFAPALRPMRILSINDCHYVPVRTSDPEIVLARVAGCETAVYGLPTEGVHPILFELMPSIMVATTKLSQFRTARYNPSEAWPVIWSRILDWLCPEAGGMDAASIDRRATVHPTFGPHTRLRPEIEKETFRRGVEWYCKSKLLVDPDWSPLIKEAITLGNNVSSTDRQRWPSGDGRLGLLEGYSSSIDLGGSQPARWMLRADCIGESSFAIALGGSTRDREIARNLNNFIYRGSTLAGASRADAANPAFGLLNWYTEAKGVYYGDDNARSMLGTIGASAALGASDWNYQVLRCILANFRTTGPLGFRSERIDEIDLEKNGWRHYFELKLTDYAPHYEAYLWAVYLWAYNKTGYKPFLDRTKLAIGLTMAAYPDNWRWTNGIQQERARMLLPLAWLVRIEDCPEHRHWLKLMANELLRSQEKSGAILEEIGERGKGTFPPPAQNAQYGTAEAPLIQQNGDPICDLLYTCNFALLGLHEAAAATKERIYSDAEDKLVNLLCRIQVCSKQHPKFDGAWYRAFDTRLWDYWGSNSDAGWGVWSIETGWTQGWITGVLGLRTRGTSFWDLTASSQIRHWMDELRPLLLPDGCEEIPTVDSLHG